MRRLAGAAVAAAILAGCGGSASAVPGRLSASSKQVPVAISIKVPSVGTKASDNKRRPAYVSVATRSAVVNVTRAGGPTTRTVVNCSGFTCVGDVMATIGVDTFAIALTDSPYGTGKTLATGQTTATIVESAANTVSVTFNGIIASLQVSFDQPNPPVNTPATINVTVTAFDADGWRIVGPGTYDNPIVLSNSDATGATTLSATTIAAQSDPPVTIAYTGAWIGGESASAIITASVPANRAVGPAKGEIVPIPQVVEYTIPTNNAGPHDLTTGPDGALWFTESIGHQVGRVTTAGVFSEYLVPGNYPQPWAIAAGADGNLYFTDIQTPATGFNQITTSGIITSHPINPAPPFSARALFSIALGSDHNLWAADMGASLISRFTPAGVETDFAIPTSNVNTQAITAGPDGALWFTEIYNTAIGKITTAGTVTEYPVNQPIGQFVPATVGITSGPDGALWFIDNMNSAIGRITTAGASAEFARNPVAFASGSAIVTGPDGGLYFGTASGTLGRVSAKGTLQGFPITKLQRRSGAFDKFAIGPDGAIWYIDARGNAVGKIVF